MNRLDILNHLARMDKVTEQAGRHRHLEQKSTRQLLEIINAEDQQVALAVAQQLDQIEQLVEATYRALASGGRLFYVGAGTSGRLGVLDASECPPTFGVPPTLVTGLIAGGDTAIRTAVEFAEDDTAQGWRDLQAAGASAGDVVVGLAASGTTPYVVGSLRAARQHKLVTGCIVCNRASPVAAESDFAVEVVVGPEVVTGSTRMKSGTAQKLVLNMLTTSVMIKLGRVADNRMVDMELTNDKLWDRAVEMVQAKHNLSGDRVRELLGKYGSVRAVLASLQTG